MIRSESCSSKAMTPVIQPSRYAAERHLFDLEQALEAIRDNRVPNWTSIAWPAGLDRTILGELPLEVRTRNCLEGAQLMEGEDALAVKEFLRLPNFGRKSLSDLLLKVEGFLKEWRSYRTQRVCLKRVNCPPLRRLLELGNVPESC